MVTIKTWEHENSHPEIREVPMTHAMNLGKNGGFYKVQIIDDQDVIVMEFK